MASAVFMTSSKWRLRFNLQPVYLLIAVRPNLGRLQCCRHLPFECLPDALCPCCQVYALRTVTINVIDVDDVTNVHNTSINRLPIVDDARLLHEPPTRSMLAHEPYTPESAESRSPAPEEGRLRSDSVVSPAQLKRRLDAILRRGGGDNDDVDDVDDLDDRSTLTLHSRQHSHHSSSDEDWFVTKEEAGPGGRGKLEVEEEEERGAVTSSKKSLNCCCVA